jgi:hypothetical protein
MWAYRRRADGRICSRMEGDVTMAGKLKKGVSGNPGGCPKVLGEVQPLAREHTATAIKRLQRREAPPAARVAASNAILDRGYGPPAQTIDTNVNHKSPGEMTDAELSRSLRAPMTMTSSRTAHPPATDGRNEERTVTPLAALLRGVGPARPTGPPIQLTCRCKAPDLRLSLLASNSPWRSVMRSSRHIGRST